MTKPCDDAAKEFRANIRALAGLPCSWDRASDGIREWYRSLAERYGDKIAKTRK